MKLLIVMMSLGLPLFMAAQVAMNAQVKVSFSDENNPTCTTSPIAIEYYQSDGWVKAATQIVKIGNCDYNIACKINNGGICRIVLSDSSTVEVVLTPTSKLDVQLVTTNNASRINTDDAETKAYYEFSQILAKRQQELNMLDEKRQKISIVDSRYYTLKDRNHFVTDSIREKYNRQLAKFALARPNTYAADVLVKIAAVATRHSTPAYTKQFDGHHSFYHKHFFDGIPLKDTRILNNPLFAGQLDLYLNNYAGEVEKDYLEAADYMLGKATQLDVREFIVNRYIKVLLSKGQMTVIKYLFDNYEDGCNTDNDVNANIRKLLHPSVIVGGAVPDAQVEVNGKSVALTDLLNNHKANLLVFWKSDCDHCHELLFTLNKYQLNKYNIVTLLVDKPANNNYKQYLQDTNTNAMYGDGVKQLLEKLGIYKSPTIVLVERGVVIKITSNINEINLQ